MSVPFKPNATNQEAISDLIEYQVYKNKLV